MCQILLKLAQWFNIKQQIGKHTEVQTDDGREQGRIQEFWLGGAWIFFSKAWGLGAALRPPEGPGQRPDSFQGAKLPEAPNFSDFRSKI